MSNTRLSYVPSKFVARLDVVDELQLSDGTPPNTKKYMDWGWKDTESAHVTLIRKKADEYFELMKDKKNCPTVVRDQMTILIADFMAYDHGKTEPHKLWDKIAAFGSITDCESAGVKRGTPLAKAPTEDDEVPIVEQMLKALIGIRVNAIGMHLLSVVNSASPSSKALPKGIKFAKVFVYIGTEPPANLKQYYVIGNARRGMFLNKLNDIEPVEGKDLYAWYIVRYENTRGELGEPSNRLKAEIFFEAE
jgi:hypothetical protein